MLEVAVLLGVTLLLVVAFLTGIVIGENVLLASLQHTNGKPALGLQSLRKAINALTSQGATDSISLAHGDRTQLGTAPPSTASQQEQQRHAQLQRQGSLLQHAISDADRAASRNARQRSMLSHPVHEWYITDADFEYFQVPRVCFREVCGGWITGNVP